jgi:hypothetical protein
LGSTCHVHLSFLPSYYYTTTTKNEKHVTHSAHCVSSTLFVTRFVCSPSSATFPHNTCKSHIHKKNKPSFSPRPPLHQKKQKIHAFPIALPTPALLGNSTFTPRPTQFRLVASLCPSLTCPTDGPIPEIRPSLAKIRSGAWGGALCVHNDSSVVCITDV